jgi:hypothetical protein
MSASGPKAAEMLLTKPVDFATLGHHDAFAAWINTTPAKIAVCGHATIQLGSQSAQDGENVECPSWVKLVILTMRRPLPVHPDKQTFSASIGMSQRCQQRT